MGIDGKMRVLSGEEAAGEELRLHGGLLQPGASIISVSCVSR